MKNVLLGNLKYLSLKDFKISSINRHGKVKIILQMNISLITRPSIIQTKNKTYCSFCKRATSALIPWKNFIY